jgi:hypothetical protein
MTPASNSTDFIRLLKVDWTLGFINSLKAHGLNAIGMLDDTLRQKRNEILKWADLPEDFMLDSFKLEKHPENSPPTFSHMEPQHLTLHLHNPITKKTFEKIVEQITALRNFPSSPEIATASE